MESSKSTFNLDFLFPIITGIIATVIGGIVLNRILTKDENKVEKNTASTKSYHDSTGKVGITKKIEENFTPVKESSQKSKLISSSGNQEPEVKSDQSIDNTINKQQTVLVIPSVNEPIDLINPIFSESDLNYSECLNCPIAFFTRPIYQVDFYAPNENVKKQFGDLVVFSSTPVRETLKITIESKAGVLNEYLYPNNKIWKNDVNLIKRKEGVVIFKELEPGDYLVRGYTYSDMKMTFHKMVPVKAKGFATIDLSQN